jgi:hypothetical protein
MWSRLMTWSAGAVRKCSGWFFAPWMRAVRCGYEKGGITVYGEPVPWNAEAVLAEFLLEFPGSAPTSTEGFRWSLPVGVALESMTLHPGDEEGSCRLRFRMSPIRRTTAIGLSWHRRLLGRVILPYLGPGEFLRHLRLESPCTLTELAGRDVACGSVVVGQCRHLTACGLLKSPTSLLPVIDWDLSLELTRSDSDQTWRLPVQLTAGQVSARQALVSATLRPWPSAPATWSWRWVVAERTLARGELRVLDRDSFYDSLSLAGGLSRCGQVENVPGRLVLQAREDASGTCPCVRVTSREPGIAALCSVEVRLHFRDRERLPEVLEKELLVTDTPSLSSPVALPTPDFHEVTLIEVTAGGRFLGSVNRRPTPVARFTSEGGFKPPAAYNWDVFAEEELEAMLGRLAGAPP